MADIPKKPCKECPFRRKAAPGYTGDATPTEFIAATLGDAAMPCHTSVDYSDPQWKEKWIGQTEGAYQGKAKHCAGAATFFANMGKLSRDRERPRKERDTENVFATPAEFADHHGAELPFLYNFGRRKKS